eukprot:4872809-Prymnesium_polylepis.2
MRGHGRRFSPPHPTQHAQSLLAQSLLAASGAGRMATGRAWVGSCLSVGCTTHSHTVASDAPSGRNMRSGSAGCSTTKLCARVQVHRVQTWSPRATCRPATVSYTHLTLPTICSV